MSSITIPNGVKSIEEKTFFGCTGLRSINIPNSVRKIGSRAFWGCTDLLVSLPVETKIADDSFDDTAIITLRTGMTQIRGITNETSHEISIELLLAIQNLMQNTGWSAEQAMDALGIPKQMQSSYISHLDEN